MIYIYTLLPFSLVICSICVEWMSEWMNSGSQDRIHWNGMCFETIKRECVLYNMYIFSPFSYCILLLWVLWILPGEVIIVLFLVIVDKIHKPLPFISHCHHIFTEHDYGVVMSSCVFLAILYYVAVVILNNAMTDNNNNINLNQC